MQMMCFFSLRDPLFCSNGTVIALNWSFQVINAALALAAKPNSKVAQDNMDLFKEQWEKQVRVLTDAVDDITSIDDFLSVSGKRPGTECLLLCRSFFFLPAI